jgi:FkbM family methyltransferase
MRNWNQFFEHIKSTGFAPVNIFDIGVATDTNELYQHFPSARYCFIEPLAEFEPSLQHLCNQYPGSVYLLAAAGATDGELELQVSPDLGGTSKFSLVNAEIFDMTTRTVSQVKIDTAWTTLELSGASLLKVDVQGAELEVLRGAENCLDNFEIILLETGLTEVYVGQPIFHEYIAYMAERDYVVYDIIHAGYGDTGLLCQIDLVFVKRTGQFRQDLRAVIDPNKAQSLNNYKGIRRNDNL